MKPSHPPQYKRPAKTPMLALHYGNYITESINIEHKRNGTKFDVSALKRLEYVQGHVQYRMSKVSYGQILASEF